ncbi:MAG: hypothetical protein LBJ67_03295 [Planctomycetaceae bacterium]|nr:hypothetical protein [Planctomycetaceae bacterium]
MKKNVLLLCAVWLMLSLVFAIGCAPKSVNTVKVTGTITIDGKPLEQGGIKFSSVNNDTTASGGTITNGTYAAEVPPGKKKVLIIGVKVVGREKLYDTPDSPTREKLETVTPTAYNKKELTPLEADITGETKDLNFELSSKFKHK